MQFYVVKAGPTEVHGPAFCTKSNEQQKKNWNEDSTQGCRVHLARTEKLQAYSPGGEGVNIINLIEKP